MDVCDLCDDPDIVSTYELRPGDLVMNDARDPFFIIATSRRDERRWSICRVTFMSYACKLFTLDYYDTQTRFYRLVDVRTVSDTCAGVK